MHEVTMMKIIDIQATYFWTVFLCLWVRVHSQFSPVLAKNLLDELYNDNYSSLVRPSATVQVNTSLTVYTINSLNIIEQTFSVSGMLCLTWTDSRLAWSSLSDYSAVKFLFNTEENTWVPPIFVQNSVEDMEVISDENWTMRINPDGTVAWNPADVYKVSCECDIKYYPFDKQLCNILFTTAGYSYQDIQFNDDSNAVDVSNYVENGEWLIVSVGAKTSGSASSVSGGDATYSKIEFSFVLKRRHVFHIINTVFPVIVMVFLIPLVFKLDLGSGDKPGYALTVLLSYSVYLTMIADHIPSTSVSVCYVSLYLALMLAVSTISVPFGILVVHLYNKEEDEPMSPCIESLSRKFLMRIVCCNKVTCCRQRRRSGSVGVIPNANDNTGANHIHISKDDLRNSSEISDDDSDTLTWQNTACLLDHFLFVLFTCIVFLFTFVFFAILGANY